MIKWETITADLVDKFNPRPEIEGVASQFFRLKAAPVMAQIIERGQGMVAVDGHDILAVLIWLTPDEGILDIGMWAGDDIYKNRRGYLRFMKSAVKILLDMVPPNVRRIQTTSYADPTHDKWMTWLGFECEGTLKKRGVDGRDLRIWAITEVTHG